MRVNRYYLLNTEPVVNGMGYFTKHLGKDLSYHNLYILIASCLYLGYNINIFKDEITN